jgi:hypothetical protein
MRSAKLTETARSRLGRPSIPLTALCCALVVGCGTSGNPRSSASGGPLLKLARCMRAHGVSNFPDPSSSGGLIIPNDVNTDAPTFKAAQAVCNKLVPGGGPGNGPPSAQVKASMLSIAKCMRAHNVTDFPDPTTKPPPDPSAYRLVIGHGGVYLAVPNTITVDSPAFKQAAAACRFGVGQR